MQSSPTVTLNDHLSLLSTPMQSPSCLQPVETQSQQQQKTNTFVHKLYNMVIDSQYQHLIAWTYTGSSFVVCNIMEFSRDVLPKHFKHNNFSSFVRQLNMYGFHKVNKSPRGHRTLAENQIWEFSHPKFLRNRPDLLDDIKRKAVETDNTRRDTSNMTRDLHSHMTMMQVHHTDMMQRINQLFDNFNELVKELAETKRIQAAQEQVMKNMVNYIMQQNGGQLPLELSAALQEQEQQQHSTTTPSIFITSPERSPMDSNSNNNNMYRTTPLTVNTQNLWPPPHSPTSVALSPSPISPLALSPYSPNPLVPDDDCSLYSPHTPNTPLSSISQQHFLDPPTPRPSSSSSTYTDTLHPS